MFARWLSLCVDVLFPLGCAGCDEPVCSQRIWCEQCQARLIPVPAESRAQFIGCPVIAAHAYAGPVQHAVHHFKFSNRADLAPRLACDLARAIKSVVLPRDSILVPVPLTAQRLVERGYNQSALLASNVARELELEHAPCALSRVRDGHHQVGSNRAERAKQVSGAFAAASRRIDRRNVILVDDVITTGATASACIAALTAAGARIVAVAAIARVVQEASNPRKLGE